MFSRLFDDSALHQPAVEPGIMVVGFGGQKEIESVDDYILENYNDLDNLYTELVSSITNNESVLKHHFDEETVVVAKAIAVSALTSIQGRAATYSYISRDRQMAENVRFIREKLFPGKNPGRA